MTNKMALCSKSFLGKLGKVLSGILPGKTNLQVIVEASPQVLMLANLARKKQTNLPGKKIPSPKSCWKGQNASLRRNEH
jgi:hypothetical protein